ncbi:hypothetical protein [Paenibacillus humicola]|uniref:hypothetical protein n=1 Tax=Paenibacillus humicola TaxID=3110540 RepID=UPI00237BB1BD|nr:hypothetical protein [Paenibacillus humicola]
MPVQLIRALRESGGWRHEGLASFRDEASLRLTASLVTRYAVNPFRSGDEEQASMLHGFQSDAARQPRTEPSRRTGVAGQPSLTLNQGALSGTAGPAPRTPRHELRTGASGPAAISVGHGYRTDAVRQALKVWQPLVQRAAVAAPPDGAVAAIRAKAAATAPPAGALSRTAARQAQRTSAPGLAAAPSHLAQRTSAPGLAAAPPRLAQRAAGSGTARAAALAADVRRRAQAPAAAAPADARAQSAGAADPALAMHYTAAARQPAPPPAVNMRPPATLLHAAKQAAAASPAPVAAAPPQGATPGFDARQLQQMLAQLPQLQPDVIAENVYKALEKKMKFEQRRRGF